MFRYSLILLASEILVDSIKHFFITRLNNLDVDLYLQFKNMIFRKHLEVMLRGVKIRQDDEKNKEDTAKILVAY